MSKFKIQGENVVANKAEKIILKKEIDTLVDRLQLSLPVRTFVG